MMDENDTIGQKTGGMQSCQRRQEGLGVEDDDSQKGRREDGDDGMACLAVQISSQVSQGLIFFLSSAFHID